MRNCSNFNSDDFPYFNRELSWLKFNKRVLNQAESNEYPLLERMKFLAFVSTNLDEFFEIRVAGCIQEIKSGNAIPSPDGLDPKEQLKKINSFVKDLLIDQSKCWNKILIPELKKSKILFLKYEEMNPREKKWISNYFIDYIFPVLTPLALDPAHPFPHIVNKALYLMVSLKKGIAKKHQNKIAIIPIPRILPRVIKVDIPRRDKAEVYIFIDEIVQKFINKLFPGYIIKSALPFRITRNSDLYIDKEEVVNLLNKVEEELANREKGAAVRMETKNGYDEKLIKKFFKVLDLDNNHLYVTEGPINPSRLMEVYDLIDRPNLKFKVHYPRIPLGYEKPELIFKNLNKKDLLLHQPYDSFQPLIDLIKQSSIDPDVLAIKQTLYRTSGNSPIIKSLIEASENGKQVTVIIEIKARFDEANNIHWAKQLEEAGVHVVYGIVGLKTHCKCCMIVRRERKKLKRYVHLSTGNYNPKTARLYTDLSLLTTRSSVAREVSDLFNLLTGYGRTPNFKKLLIAPFNLHSTLQKLILREGKNAISKKPARIIIQANSLVDEETIRNLYKASQAGVKIDLIIRGICNLIPNVKGISDNIRVKSVLGRFLEHSRIYYFENSKKENYLLYAGSADLMPRNFFKRIECVFPIEDIDNRQRILSIINTYLKDNKNSDILKNSGKYNKPSITKRDISCQERFINESRTPSDLNTSIITNNKN